MAERVSCPLGSGHQWQIGHVVERPTVLLNVPAVLDDNLGPPDFCPTALGLRVWLADSAPLSTVDLMDARGGVHPGAVTRPN